MKKVLAPVEILVAYICLTGFVYEPQRISPAINSPLAKHKLIGVNGHSVYKKGDLVPHYLVCMVNNMYMGKLQLEVSFYGRIYYGCCEMCRKRIPTDESVRMAIDPVSKKQVDKANAVIAITGDEGEVHYFENKENVKAFFAKRK